VLPPGLVEARERQIEDGVPVSARAMDLTQLVVSELVWRS
jgi:hypothetical protein